MTGLDGEADIVHKVSSPHQAAACIQEHGIALIENAIPASAVSDALEYFHHAFDSYMRPATSRLFRNYQDDPRRAQIPVAPAGALANPVIYANETVLAIVRLLVGENIIVGEMGAVISHPGAAPQYTHRDSKFLFGGIPDEIDLPPYSVTMLVPLTDVPMEMGPTEFWPGSHRVVDDSRSENPQRKAMKAGSVLLWDARLLHRGGANLSQSVRPAVYITYQRPWYFERSGYESKPQVRITPALLGRLPVEHRPLFDWALHLNRADSFDEFVMRWIGRIRSRLGRRAE